MAINTITIDFYGTLVRDNEAAVKEVCRKISQTAHKVLVSPGEIGVAWWRMAEDMIAQERFYDSKSIEKKAIKKLVERFNSSEDPEELYFEIMESLKKPMMYPDTQVFLERLPLPFAIVANGDSDIIRQALDFTKIAAGDIISSDRVRAYKPDAKIFREAIKILGAKAGDILHVGDSMKYDIAPAKRVGMNTCWINRKKIPMSGRSRPDVECHSLLDLRMIIK